MQVREHTESTTRQYGLAEEAARLGWPVTDIEVIDADLGLSGRSVTHPFMLQYQPIVAIDTGAIEADVVRYAHSGATTPPPPTIPA